MRGRKFALRENLWVKEQEYQALRRFIKLAGCSEEDGLASRMAQAIEGELTERQRQLVRMYYMDQRTMRDISAELGLSVSTVSRTLARSRTRLRRYLRYGGRAIFDAIDDG
ncbi:MAG: sigma-70 family RNA polymerase sigma factor [Oscillospiraceae bacterium]